jgi:hypothetical protein
MIENEPKSVDGWQAWDISQRCAGQIRTAGMGQPIGIDLGVALRMAEVEGADPAVMTNLLPALEAGMVAGFAKLLKERGTEE